MKMWNDNAKYQMIFNMDHTVDGIGFDSFEAAKADMEDTYANWMVETINEWEHDENGIPSPTKEQIEDYDYMIDNYCCWIVEKDDETGEYEDIDYGYCLPDTELKALGWMYWDEFVKQNGWQ